MIRDKFDLSGKVILVVGGRGFLGRRFCAALGELGAGVFSADLPEMSHAARKDADATPNEGIKQFNVDVTDIESVKQLVEAISTEASSIDVLVYSVTVRPSDFYAPFTKCSLEGWQQVMRAEMDGLFLVTQQVGRVMEAAGRGSIILMSSIYGIVGNDQRIYEGSNLAELYSGDKGRSGEGKRVYSHASYSAVKGGVISLTRYLAAYWEGRIRVNCISPGGVEHPGEDAGFVSRYSRRVPMGRKADPDEISGAVVYLASEASSYVNGHNLIVDGGWTVW